MTPLSFYKSSPSEYPQKLFRSSRFRSKTTQTVQFGYDDDGDDSSEEEMDEEYFEPHTRQRIHVRNNFSVQQVCLALLLFILTFLVVRVLGDGPVLYANFTEAPRCASVRRMVRTQLASFCGHIQAISHSWLHDRGKPDPAVTEANFESQSFLSTITLPPPVALDPSISPSIDFKPLAFETPDATDFRLKAVDERIDAAIARHTANSLPLRDFALNAEFIPYLTSYTPSTSDFQRMRGLRWLNSIFGLDIVGTLSHAPTSALTDGGNDEQSCWLFEGSAGYLGIRLQSRISVESFSIEHFPRDLLPDLEVLRAPRKVVLWGLIEGPHNLSKDTLHREYMHEGPMSMIFSQSSFVLHAKQGELYIPLASFEYKLSGKPQSHIQTKRISQALQSLQLDFQTVVLEVISNWGGSSTCLYRVQVHGSPLKAIALPSF